MQSHSRHSQLTIVGLYPHLSDIPEGEVWTLNDWYIRHPHIIPDRIFNIHLSDYAGGEQHKPELGRFAGDYKQRYRDSGAEIITLEPTPGLDTTLINTQLMEMSFPIGSLTSSIPIMIGYGLLKGFKQIHLTGCRLIGSEYVYEIPGLLTMIEFVRSNGVEFTTDYESEWYRDLGKIDWSSIRTRPTYWARQVADVGGMIKLKASDIIARLSLTHTQE